VRDLRDTLTRLNLSFLHCWLCGRFPLLVWCPKSLRGGAIPSQYAADPSFTTDPFSGAFLSADVTDDVAAWLANPADNQGWAFISDDLDEWGFKTSMDKPSEHPKLVVVAANCP
jgi:hypothetical protein